MLYVMTDYSFPFEQIQVIVMAHNPETFREMGTWFDCGSKVQVL